MTAATAAPAPSVRSAARRRIVRRFRRRPLAVVGLLGVLIAVLLALFGPFVTPYDPTLVDPASVLRPPLTGGHLLGTDDVGRDLLSRVMAGAQASLVAGVFSTLLALVVAIPVGMVAGYYRGWVDPVVSRVTDVVLAFPFLIVAVGLAAVLGPSLLNETIALAVAQLPGFVRVVRGEVMSLRGLEYVEAAVVNGAPDRVILGRHLLPNVLNPLVVQVTVAIPGAIIGASVLSFLGLGEQPPTPSWGTMLSDAQQYVTQAPWFAVFPGLAIALTTLSFNLFGDGLRDVLDVRMRS